MRRTWLALLLFGCGSTGSDRFDFAADARGRAPATFVNAAGWSVHLERARFVVGPVYLAPQAGRDAERYVGEVLERVTVDVLAPAPTPFPTAGSMTEDVVRSAEIWVADVDFAGEATRGEERVPFDGHVVLDELQRRVRGVPVTFVPREGGALELSIDARVLFAGADFHDPDQLTKTAAAGLRATATYEVKWLEHR